MTEKNQSVVLDVLTTLEWSGQGKRYDDGTRAPVCPSCGGDRPLAAEDKTDNLAAGRGHLPGCALVTALAVLSQEA